MEDLSIVDVVSEDGVHGVAFSWLNEDTDEVLNVIEWDDGDITCCVDPLEDDDE
jgi:hypothetical protein